MQSLKELSLARSEELDTKISMAKNMTTQLQQEVETKHERQISLVDSVLEHLKQEMVRVNKTLERDATKETQERRKIAELQLEKAKWEKEREILHADEAKEKLLEQDRRENRTREQARQQVDYENAEKLRREEEAIKLQEKSDLHKEQVRRETEEALIKQRAEVELNKAQVELDTVVAKAQAEAEGRAKQERDNVDIKLKLQAAKAAARREQLIVAIELIFVSLATWGRDLMQNSAQLLRMVGATIALAGGIYLVRELSKVAARELERRLGKPSLVRDTSRLHGGGLASFLTQKVAAAWSLLHSKWSAQYLKDSGDDEETRDDSTENAIPDVSNLERFRDVILAGQCSERVFELAIASRNAQRNRAPYRHLLFYGPAGTGKSMVAKRLAQFSGMDWAIMSGGDVGPLGEQAVTDLHNLFSWARSSKNGLMLFIDEAEAFLGSRSRTSLTAHMRNALNALLFQTGDQSRHFMLVLATNRPADLDAAVLDRIDEALHFSLPELPQREKLMVQYFSEHILQRVAAAHSDSFIGRVSDLVSRSRIACRLTAKPIRIANFDKTSYAGDSGSTSSAAIDTDATTEPDEEEVDGAGAGEGDWEAGEEDDQAGEADRTSRRRASRRGGSRSSRTRTPTRGRSSRRSRRAAPCSRNSRSRATRGVAPREPIFTGPIAGSERLDAELHRIGMGYMYDGVAEWLRRASHRTDGFSGRQIAKLMISCQGMIYGTTQTTLTPDLFWKVVKRKVDEYRRKKDMAEASEMAASNDSTGQRPAVNSQYNYA